MPGRYVPILHQRPPEQEPRERPPCSVRNNRVTSTCPEFHGDHLFEHAYTRCIPPVCSSSPTLNIKKESRVLRDFKYIKKESTLFHLLDILLIPLSITLKNIYIYMYPILLPRRKYLQKGQSALEIPTREYLVENWSILRNHPV